MVVEAPPPRGLVFLWSGVSPILSFSLGEVESEPRSHCGMTEGALDVKTEPCGFLPEAQGHCAALGWTCWR